MPQHVASDPLVGQRGAARAPPPHGCLGLMQKRRFVLRLLQLGSDKQPAGPASNSVTDYVSVRSNLQLLIHPSDVSIVSDHLFVLFNSTQSEYFTFEWVEFVSQVEFWLKNTLSG